ncbi:MAG TPA: carbohydrate kinase family protein [Candidatus Sulfotelmatobacter sp.]|nr:carbohydrate kinase family protein [Candidatus Sulfotelmatobacter sp.]
MLDILCIGDAVIDIFLNINKDNPHFGLDKKENKLLISFGEKINVEKYVLDVGGNAANTSVGLSRLGLNTGILAEIGKDEFSQKIMDKFREENINSEFVIQTESEKTSFSIGINYDGERTLFVEHVQRDHNFNFEKVSTKFIYLTSLGKNWEKAYINSLSFVQKNNIKLAFNPGTLQIENRNKLITEIIENTDYLFLNKEEAELILYGKELGVISKTGNENIIKKLLFGIKSLGAKNVIITDSKNGSYVFDERNKMLKFEIIDVAVVEKTGAGDAYSSGFLAAILKSLSIEEAMIWGSVNASSVISQVGAEKGLLLKEDLEEKLKFLKNLNVKELE